MCYMFVDRFNERSNVNKFLLNGILYTSHSFEDYKIHKCYHRSIPVNPWPNLKVSENLSKVKDQRLMNSEPFCTLNYFSHDAGSSNSYHKCISQSAKFEYE